MNDMECNLSTAPSPDARLHELATILAAGVLRLPRPGASCSLEISPESSETCLEVPAPTVLTVPRAVNSLRDKEIRRKR